MTPTTNAYKDEKFQKKTEIYSKLHEAVHFVISSTSYFVKSEGSLQYSQKPLLDSPKLQRVQFLFSHHISVEFTHQQMHLHQFKHTH